MSPAVSEVLSKAADVIETVGWCQESYVDDDGEMCVVGALCFAAGLDPDEHGDDLINDDVLTSDALIAAHRARKAFDEYLGPGVLATEWNDKPERTKAEVVAALRVAAERYAVPSG